jgi:hypothetical protein
MQMQDALTAQAGAVPFPGTAEAGRPHDATHNAIMAYPSEFPAGARAVIHCPAPSVVSAGRRRATEWLLTFEPHARPFIEPLMGWTGGTDTLSQIRLRFPSREAAIAYARRQGLPYEVREPVYIRRGDLARAERMSSAVEDPVPPEIGWMWDTPHLVWWFRSPPYCGSADLRTSEP